MRPQIFGSRDLDRRIGGEEGGYIYIVLSGVPCFNSVSIAHSTQRQDKMLMKGPYPAVHVYTFDLSPKMNP